MSSRSINLTPPQSPVRERLTMPSFTPLTPSPLKRGREKRTTDVAQSAIPSDPGDSSSPLASSSSSSSSSVFTQLPDLTNLHSRERNCQKPPEAPMKRRRTTTVRGSSTTTEKVDYMGYSYKHFTMPAISGRGAIVGEGAYKKVYTVPENIQPLVKGISNKDILVQIFDASKKPNTSTENIHKFIERTIEQYRIAKHYFGDRSVVTIHNADKAIQDGYLIVEKIELSLEEVLNRLRSSPDQQKAISILNQVKAFFLLSLEREIDTDLRLDNLRVKQDAQGNYQVILIDFKEEEDEVDYIGNKKNHLQYLPLNFKGLVPDQVYEDFVDAISAKIKEKKELDIKRAGEVSLREEEEDDDVDSDFGFTLPTSLKSSFLSSGI